MLLVGKCKKCDTTIKLDVGDKCKEDVIEQLKAMGAFHCPGHHVEICSPYPHYWKVDDWEKVEGAAPTEEEFLAELHSKYEEVCDTEEMTRRGVVKGFAYGLPVTDDGKNWDFVHSPKGKRYYYCKPK